jgi:hypothetical protein
MPAIPPTRSIPKASPLEVDGRGNRRLNNAAVDLGAVEYVHVEVTTLQDEDNGGIDPAQGAGTSLREAINYVNSQPAPAGITFASGLAGTLALDPRFGELPLNDTTATLTIAAPASGLTINARYSSRILEVGAGSTADVRNLSFVNGDTFKYSSGSGAGSGAAILNHGTLILIHASLSQGIASYGGGIANLGSMTVTDSTFSSNQAVQGGAILNQGDVLLVNCTLSNNLAFSQGGGIYNLGTLKAVSNTIAGNLSDTGGGLYNFNFGDALPGFAELVDNVFADSLGGAIGGNGTISSDSSANLIDDAANAGGLTDGVNQNIVGHAALLGPLGDYGGLTQTMPLLPGSPALDVRNLRLTRSLRRSARPVARRNSGHRRLREPRFHARCRRRQYSPEGICRHAVRQPAGGHGYRQ